MSVTYDDTDKEEIIMTDGINFNEFGVSEFADDESMRYELIAQVARNYDDLNFDSDTEQLVWDSDDTVVDLERYMLTE